MDALDELLCSLHDDDHAEQAALLHMLDSALDRHCTGQLAGCRQASRRPALQGHIDTLRARQVRGDTRRRWFDVERMAAKLVGVLGSERFSSSWTPSTRSGGASLIP